MPLKIISIDPAGDGATAFIIASVDGKNIESIDNFGILDYGFNEYLKENPLVSRETIRQKQFKLTKKFIDFMIDEDPDLVIIENFIQYKKSMGQYGKTFPTSELIGVLEYELRKKDIPTVRVIASSLRKPLTAEDYYYYEVEKEIEVMGEDKVVRKEIISTVNKVPKPRKFKDELTRKALQQKGLIVVGRYNKTYIIANGEEYDLSNYKVGSKNDHALMALRHLVNFIDTKDVNQKVQKIINDREVDDE